MAGQLGLILYQVALFAAPHPGLLLIAVASLAAAVALWAVSHPDAIEAIDRYLIEPIRRALTSARLRLGSPKISPEADIYWHGFGVRHGLVFNMVEQKKQLFFSLRGYYRNCLTEMTSSVAVLEAESKITIYLPQPLNEGLFIYPENEITRTLAPSLKNDLIVGDQAFDAAFVVSVVSNGDRVKTRERLNPAVRARLLRIWHTLEAEDEFHLTDETISCRFPKAVDNPETVLPLINAMVDVIDAISENRGRLFIKAVTVAERCEVCHQTDHFEAQTGHCNRCNHTSR